MARDERMKAVAKGHNRGIHLTRGLCAIGVAGYHYLSWEHGIAVESAGAFLVYVFFTISALTLMMVHTGDFARNIDFEGRSTSIGAASLVSCRCWAVSLCLLLSWAAPLPVPGRLVRLPGPI